jgi:hypothetical protein
MFHLWRRRRIPRVSPVVELILMLLALVALSHTARGFTYSASTNTNYFDIVWSIDFAWGETTENGLQVQLDYTATSESAYTPYLLGAGVQIVPTLEPVDGGASQQLGNSGSNSISLIPGAYNIYCEFNFWFYEHNHYSGPILIDTVNITASGVSPVVPSEGGTSGEPGEKIAFQKSFFEGETGADYDLYFQDAEGNLSIVQEFSTDPGDQVSVTHTSDEPGTYTLVRNELVEQYDGEGNPAGWANSTAVIGESRVEQPVELALDADGLATEAKQDEEIAQVQTEGDETQTKIDELKEEVNDEGDETQGLLQDIKEALLGIAEDQLGDFGGWAGDGQFDDGMNPVGLLSRPSISSIGGAPTLGSFTIGGKVFDLDEITATLSTVGNWLRNFILWVVGVGVLYFICKTWIDAVNSTFQTPGITTSGGSLTGDLGPLMVAAYMAVVVTAIAGLAVLFTNLLIGVGISTSEVMIDPLSGAPSNILTGLKIVDIFIPIPEMVTFAFAGIITVGITASMQFVAQFLMKGASS